MNDKDELILNVSSILLSGNNYRLRSSQYLTIWTHKRLQISKVWRRISLCIKSIKKPKVNLWKSHDLIEANAKVMSGLNGTQLQFTSAIIQNEKDHQVTLEATEKSAEEQNEMLLKSREILNNFRKRNYGSDVLFCIFL
jgi:hypothetical protein